MQRFVIVTVYHFNIIFIMRYLLTASGHDRAMTDLMN